MWPPVPRSETFAPPREPPAPRGETMIRGANGPPRGTRPSHHGAGSPLRGGDGRFRGLMGRSVERVTRFAEWTARPDGPMPRGRPIDSGSATRYLHREHHLRIILIRSSLTWIVSRDLPLAGSPALEGFGPPDRLFPRRVGPGSAAERSPEFLLCSWAQETQQPFWGQTKSHRPLGQSLFFAHGLVMQSGSHSTGVAEEFVVTPMLSISAKLRGIRDVTIFFMGYLQLQVAGGPEKT